MYKCIATKMSFKYIVLKATTCNTVILLYMYKEHAIKNFPNFYSTKNTTF